MQTLGETEPKKHLETRLRIEQYLKNNDYEILNCNTLTCNFGFFGEAFKSLLGRFGSRLEYVHNYDIVAKKDFTHFGKKKHTLFYVIEVDGWNTRHGENASKRTRLHQQKKDVIAQGIFKICADIIILCNRDESIDFDFLRVRQEQIAKCKTDEDIKKCFIAAASETYLWSSSAIQ